MPHRPLAVAAGSRRTARIRAQGALGAVAPMGREGAGAARGASAAASRPAPILPGGGSGTARPEGDARPRAQNGGGSEEAARGRARDGGGPAERRGAEAAARPRVTPRIRDGIRGRGWGGGAEEGPRLGER